MQDLRTGELKLVNSEIFKDVPVLAMQDALAKIQQAKDETIPERSAQGSMFFVGQELEIMGARFKVDMLTPKKMILKSLPAK